MRALNPNVDQGWGWCGAISNLALTHPAGTNDILFGGASTGEEKRGAGKGRCREVFADKATFMPAQATLMRPQSTYRCGA
jgi:hypothetical protein